MRAQLPPYLRRALGFLLALAFASLGAFAQSGLKADRASAEHFTKSLMALNAQYQAAPPDGKAALFLQLRSVAAQRQQLLSSLIQTRPGEVLRVAIPGGIAATLPAFVQSLVEQETDAQGELEVMVEDAKTAATLHHYVKTGSQRLELKFAADAPTNLLTGSIVHVHGTRMNNVLALGSGKNKGNINPVSPPPPVNTLGAQNTLVILVNFKDLTTQPFSLAAAQNTMFAATGSVNSWELENSLQQTWLTGDVTGWFTIQVSSTTCDTTLIASDAQSAAQAAGYNLSSYSHYMYVFPYTSACAWGGLATVGGSDSWVNGTLDIEIAAHELGHNFGLYHSHNLNCGTTVLCSNGSVGEYGDAFDLMGAAFSGDFNAFQKERLGWLNSGVSPPITTVTSSGTYDIGPYEAQDTTAKALKILQSSSSGSYYYVEFRQPLGFDSFVSAYSDVVTCPHFPHTGSYDVLVFCF
jgi:Gametolysin peptidase M11